MEGRFHLIIDKSKSANIMKQAYYLINILSRNNYSYVHILVV